MLLPHLDLVARYQSQEAQLTAKLKGIEEHLEELEGQDVSWEVAAELTVSLEQSSAVWNGSKPPGPGLSCSKLPSGPARQDARRAEVRARALGRPRGAPRVAGHGARNLLLSVSSNLFESET
jgi:hypothetical protein